MKTKKYQDKPSIKLNIDYIIDLYTNKKISCSKIAKIHNLNKSTIRRILIKNGIDTSLKPNKYYTNRKNKILKMIHKGFRFQYIANKYGITKQRVNQIAYNNKIHRQKNIRKKYKKLINKIYQYVQNNPYATYQDIRIKFNLTYGDMGILRNYHGLNLSLSSILQNRNKSIINDYFNNKLTATDIINKNYGITTQQAIYKICYSSGHYHKLRTKYNLKKRYFEKKEIFDLIFNLRNNKKMNFKNICNYLNDNNYKTIYGRKFRINNVKYKYNKSKELLK